ncbi:hypothetical protein [Parafrankia discariae]|uniref:hypothetical protein n=1 Tax=Parafrankia discariae TaxID=365528 RepID=UPI000378A463|nr:hypothetical protein [Parafrankia discariae]
MNASENPPAPPAADAPTDHTDSPLGWPADRLIGYREFAELVTAMTGKPMAVATLRKYASIGLLCEPDEMLADRKRWCVRTARTWQDNRKGRGAPGHERASRRKAD